MQAKTKKKSKFLNQKTHNDIFEKKYHKPIDVVEKRTKKRTYLRTTMLNPTMETNKNPNSGRIVFSLRLLSSSSPFVFFDSLKHTYSPFFLSPFFLSPFEWVFPFFLSFPFFRFFFLCATHSPKKT